MNIVYLHLKVYFYKMFSKDDIEKVSVIFRFDYCDNHTFPYFGSIREELLSLLKHKNRMNILNNTATHALEYSLGEFPLKSLFKFNLDENASIFEFIKYDNQVDSDYRVVGKNVASGVIEYFNSSDNAFRIFRNEELLYFRKYLLL